MNGPTISFWQARFEQGQTPWDRGGPSPKLEAWQAQHALPAAGARVAVPGCGSGWDVAAWAERGYDVVGIDYAPAAVARTRELLIERRLSASVIEADVLRWQPAAALDAVYEQTCLCALHPDHWVAYAEALYRWLRPGGRLYALFMQARRAQADEGRIDGPPYHCDITAMRALFPEPRWAWPKPPLRARGAPGSLVRARRRARAPPVGVARRYTGIAAKCLTRSSTKLVLQSSTLGCLSSVSMMKRE